MSEHLFDLFRLELLADLAPEYLNFFSTYYPEIPWKSVIGLRNVISHEYQDTDHGEIFNIIKLDIPKLTLVVGTIINDVTSGRYDDFLNKKE